MLRRVITNSLQQALFKPRYYSSVLDEGSKTTVSFLHQEIDDMLLVRAYNDFGFRLSNNMFVLGPMVIFPRTVLHWNVGGLHDINPDSLILFTKLEPKPDVVVIGFGNRGTSSMAPELKKMFAQLKVGIEYLPTTDAVSTFNYLNGDSRLVAGAFLPLRDVRKDSDQYVKLQERKQKLLDEA